MGRLAATLGVNRGEYVEFEMKRSFEWLREDRNEGKRLSAVLILKELAIAMPSYFFQQINGFFNYIMLALRDPKEQIREAAAKALRASLVVTSQREHSEKSHTTHWYIQCYEEAMKSFTEQTIRERGLSRDDHVHGTLLIFNELLRCSNILWEKRYTMLMQKLDVEQEISDEMSTFNWKSQSSWSSHHFPNDKHQPVMYESSICRKLISEKYEFITTSKYA